MQESYTHSCARTAAKNKKQIGLQISRSNTLKLVLNPWLAVQDFSTFLPTFPLMDEHIFFMYNILLVLYFLIEVIFSCYICCVISFDSVVKWQKKRILEVLWKLCLKTHSSENIFGFFLGFFNMFLLNFCHDGGHIYNYLRL